MNFLFFAVALLACLIGKICGMGGGVIIKPVLDACHVTSVPAINFLSGCTVLGMSLWSVGKSLLRGEKEIELKDSLPLGVGAAVGGIAGKELFSLAAAGLGNASRAGGVQAVLLLAATVATLIYTINKSRVRSLHVSRWYASVFIGLVLGVLGSFLGIGGGPFNMAVLFLFFSMGTKIATQNSLFVILLSQAAGLLNTVISGKVPDVPPAVLIGMILCGIAGSEIGGRIHKRISERTNTVLFEASMGLVILIAAYNVRLLFA
ncbi:MAG: sulfite exporter TauE/SafE family protein [Oscillospiraceae bacterium]|nr:sulfite exporter TauE/SafE family protein [Oscillospiraceae bacterium]